jgi:hypothetical protein
MIGWIDRYHNGVVVRPVFYLGKRWNDHYVSDRNAPGFGAHFASVSSDSRQRYPRTFGRLFPNGRR